MHDTSENYVFWGYTQTDQSVLRLLTGLSVHIIQKNEIIHFLCFNPKSLKNFQYEQSEPCNQKNILFV